MNSFNIIGFSSTPLSIIVAVEVFPNEIEQTGPDEQTLHMVFSKTFLDHNVPELSGGSEAIYVDGLGVVLGGLERCYKYILRSMYTLIFINFRATFMYYFM